MSTFGNFADILTGVASIVRQQTRRAPVPECS
jgi:hypothetical protein